MFNPNAAQVRYQQKKYLYFQKMIEALKTNKLQKCKKTSVLLVPQRPI